MHTNDALSRLQNIADTPDNKDVIPLNFLQHLTPNYIEHTYSHLVENSYVHNTKSIDTTQVKRKCGRPPKPKLENSNSNLKSTTAATTCTARPRKMIKIPSNDIASRELVNKINMEHKKSDSLTVAKLNTINKPYKLKDYRDCKCCLYIYISMCIYLHTCILDLKNFPNFFFFFCKKP